MSEDVSPESLPAKRVRRKRSRVRRVLTWLARGLFLLLLIAVLLAWWGVRRATDIALWGLQRAALDKQVQLSAVEIGWDRVRVKEVRLLVGRHPESVLHIAELELEYDPLALRNRELQKLMIREPRLEVTGKIALPEPRSDLAPASATAAEVTKMGQPREQGGFLQWLSEGWQLHEIAMDDLPVTIQLQGYPAMEASVGMHTGLLELNPGMLESGQLRELRIDNLRVARAGDAGRAPFLGWKRLRMLFSLREVRGGHVHVLELEEPNLRITPQSLPFLQVLRRLEEQRGGRGSQAADSAPPNTPKTRGGKIIPRVDDMRLTGGRFYLGGFPRELEVPETEVSYSISTPRPPGTAQPSEHMHEFLLEQVRIGPPVGSGPQLLRIPEVRMQTTLAQLQTRRIRQLEVRNPRVRINPAFTSFPGMYARILNYRSTMEQAAPAVGSPPAAPGSVDGESVTPATATLETPYWLVEQAQIHDAVFELSDLGARVPEMRFTASLDTMDLAWPPDHDPARAAAQPAHNRTHTVRARDFTAAAPFAINAPFLNILTLDLDVTTAQLARKQIGAARVEGVNFAFDRTFRSFVSAEIPADPVEGKTPPRAPAPPAPAAEGESPPPDRGWTVQDLAIDHAHVALRDLTLGIPDHEFALQPVRLQEMNFSPDSALLPPIPQRIEIANFAIRSPYNPLIKVISVNNVFCEFTFPGLLRNEIDKLSLLGPTVRMGEDLFWYLDRFKQNEAEPAPDLENEPVGPVATEDATPGWVIRHFEVAYGRLVYAPAGVKELKLPWSYRTETRNLQFSNLKDLQAKLSLVMHPEDYDFPELKLKVEELGGNIEFNLPLGANAKNLVNVLKARKITVQKYELDEIWASLTFDQSGAYTKLGGQAYGNDVGGELNFLPFEGFAWDGWLASGEFDLSSLNEVVGGELFSMRGRSTMKLIADGKEKTVNKVTGEFQALEPGHFHLEWADKMIADIPKEWESLKRAMMKIALETFRDYAYETGQANLEYAAGKGEVLMDFDGPNGSRDVELNLHLDQATATQLVSGVDRGEN